MPNLKPEISIGVALATATVVYGIHQNATPTIADVRSLDSQNKDIQGAERQATWLSAALVAGISLIAKDPTVFIVGGTMVIVLAWATRHADLVDTVTGRAMGTVGGLTSQTPAETQSEAPGSYSAPQGPSYDSVF